MVEATKWYLKSAEQGNTIAQLNLGFCYANGVGVPKNIVEAYAWSSLSIAADPGGISFLGPELGVSITELIGVGASDRFLAERIEKQMTPSQIEAGQKRSKELQKEIEAKIKAIGEELQKEIDAKINAKGEKK